MNIILSVSPQEFNAISLSLDTALSSLLNQYYFHKKFQPATHTEADKKFLYSNIILIQQLLETFRDQGKTIMKAKYNNIDIEGTPEEIAIFVSSIESSIPLKETTVSKNTIKSSDPKKTVSAAINFSKKASKSSIVTTTYPVIKEEDELSLSKETLDFLNSLYYYEPSKDSATGRGALTAKLILTGKPFSVGDLIKRTRSQQSTIRKTINRLRSAGCVVYVSTYRMSNKTIVQLQSMGTIEQAKSVYQGTFSPSGNVPSRMLDSNSPVIIPQ
jgi:DNA-binding MarR family transcriptional regulator